MNKTQKGAWYGLYLSVFLLIVPVVDLAGIDVTKMHPISHLLVVSIPAVLLVLPLFFINRKRKGAEAETDERDGFIIKRSIIVSLVSICALLLVAYMVTFFVPGQTSSISVEMLQILVYFSFIIFILILSVTTLVQYGWGGANHE